MSQRTFRLDPRWDYIVKEIQIKKGRLYVSNRTVKDRELVDLMERRRENILCVQKVRWKSNKARKRGEG